MKRSPWTADDGDRLRQLARNGLSLAEIAREMSRNPATIRLQASRLNIAIGRHMNRLQLQSIRGRRRS
jgi:DNA-binding NarL/FixJ family response regulator